MIWRRLFKILLVIILLFYCETLNYYIMLRFKTTFKPTAQQNELLEWLNYWMKYYGIHNKNTQIAIAGIIGKESGWKLLPEISYKNTPVSRIRMIFGSRVAQLTDAELDEIKKDDEKFFNLVYGGRGGNALDEGYKYRGRGLNHITFKDNYKMMSKLTGVDFVNNPDLLLVPKYAAQSCIVYFIDRFKTKPKDIKNLNEFENIDEAIISIFRANAGWGKKINNEFHMQTLKKSKEWTEIIEYYEL